MITSSHNPPKYGGIKYNTSHGGPADELLTIEMEKLANQFITNTLLAIKRINYQIAIKDSHYQQQDFIKPYVVALNTVVDMTAIKKASFKIGIDPLGGAGIKYWECIAEYYQLNLELVNKKSIQHSVLYF